MWGCSIFPRALKTRTFTFAGGSARIASVSITVRTKDSPAASQLIRAIAAIAIPSNRSALESASLWFQPGVFGDAQRDGTPIHIPTAFGDACEPAIMQQAGKRHGR